SVRAVYDLVTQHGRGQGVVTQHGTCAGIGRMDVAKEWSHSMAHALALDTRTWPRGNVCVQEGTFLSWG
ncbi:Os02g0500250, partial [Oryza sativa Japonica Group]